MDSLQWYNRGAELAQIGKHREAIEWYEKAIESEPDHPWPWYGKGTSLFRLGDCDEALQCFDRAIELAPNQVEPHVNKAHVLREVGRPEEAIDVYRHAAKLAPDMPQILGGLGACYFESGQLSEAAKQFRKATEFAPTFYSAWNNLGQCLLKLGRLPEARECFQKALAVKPDYEHALRGLEECSQCEPVPHNKRPGGRAPGEDVEVGQILTGLLGEYEVRIVHRGGFGVVYGAWHRRMHHMFALKTFQPRFFFDQQTVEEFLREGEIWIKIGLHPNIVPAFWVELIRGRPFVVAKYVEGGTLRRLIKARALSVPAILDFAIQICTGMMFVARCSVQAGGEGLVHRDLKPENLLISAHNELKITDFGLAKALVRAIGNADGETASAFQSVRAGTLPYMSPEQLRNEQALDMRSDIFSFGVVLYEMLTGLLPFAVGNPDELLEHIGHWRVQPPDRINPQSPKRLADIIMQCLKRDRNQRYRSFGDIRDELLPIYQELVGHPFDSSALSTEPHQSDDAAHPEIALIRGVSLAELGRTEEARKVFNTTLAEHPTQSLAWYNLALILRNDGKFEEALEALSKAEQYEEDSEMRANICIGKAAVLDELGSFSEAIEAANTAILLAEQSPHDSRSRVAALGNKANALKHLRRFQEALACYDQALERQVDDERIYHNRGHLLRMMGRWEDGLRDQEEALRVNPRSELALAEKGFVLLHLKGYVEALDCFRLARSVTDRILLLPEDHDVLYAMTAKLEEAGRAAEALQYYEALTLVVPDAATAWIGKAYCLAGIEQHNDAVDCCDRAIHINSKNYMPWLNKAVSLHELGNYEDALEAIEEALRLNPEHKNAQILRRICRAKLGLED